MAKHRYPRDKDELLREVDVRIRLNDIRRLYESKERLNPKWWEAVVLLLLFASALGLLASMIQYARVTDQPLDEWVIFWFCIMILAVVLAFEFLVAKVFALRRVNALLMRVVEDLRLRQGDVVRKVDEIVAVVNEMNAEESPAAPSSIHPIAHFGGETDDADETVSEHADHAQGQIEVEQEQRPNAPDNPSETAASAPRRTDPDDRPPSS